MEDWPLFNYLNNILSSDTRTRLKKKPIIVEFQEKDSTDDFLLKTIIKSKNLIITRDYDQAFAETTKAENVLIQSSLNFLIGDINLLYAEIAQSKRQVETVSNYFKKIEANLFGYENVDEESRDLRKLWLLKIQQGYFFDQSDFKNAMKIAETRLELSKKYNYGEIIFDCLSFLGTCHRFIGDYDKAKSTVNKALKIAEDKNDSYMKVAAFSLLGVIYQMMGDLGTSLEYNKLGLKFARLINKSEILFIPLNNLGIAFWQNGFLNDALLFLEESNAIVEKLGMKTAQGNIYTNIGLIYYTKGHYNEALDYYLKGLQIKIQAKALVSLPTSYINIGSAYNKLNDLEKAKDNFLKSIDTNPNNFKNQLVKSYYDLIILHLKLEEHENAREYYMKLEQIVKSSEYKIDKERLNLARGILLVNSDIPEEKIRAFEIFEKIIQNDMMDIEISFPAYLHYCDLLFNKFIELGKEKVWNMMKEYLSKIVQLTEKERIFETMFMAKILDTKLLLMDLKLLEAKESFHELLIEVKNRGYEIFSKQIEKELKALKEYELAENIISGDEKSSVEFYINQQLEIVEYIRNFL